MTPACVGEGSPAPAEGASPGRNRAAGHLHLCDRDSQPPLRASTSRPARENEKSAQHLEGTHHVEAGSQVTPRATLAARQPLPSWCLGIEVVKGPESVIQLLALKETKMLTMGEPLIN